MSKPSKALLTISIVTLLIGSAIWFMPIQVAPEWTVAMPISAVAFGLFLISLVVKNMTDEFDQDEARKFSANQPSIETANGKTTQAPVPMNTALVFTKNDASPAKGGKHAAIGKCTVAS